VRPENLERWSPYLFGIGLLLLLAVLTLGVVGKGAQRWLNFGVLKFQPSEIMKLAVPMMLAWFFARDSLPPRLWRLGVGLVIVLIPVAIIIKQPDLGTAVLVLAAGMLVVFLAGMHWRIILPLLGLLAAAAPFAWHFMHDYQKQRIFTLLDPEADPLGRGYHSIQSMIAVGSGGFYGKGWLNSSQAHLEYLPESHTDFVFAVFAEEFGLIGSLLLLGLYGFIAVRGLWIAYLAQDTYARLLAGGLSLAFLLHFFVNMGMVTGILPVVGIPLPIMSYGGTSIVMLLAAFGVLMSIHTHRKIVES
jgi:rod shape determining protein RodA